MRKALDRLRYKIFYRLWHVWHCRLVWFRPFMYRLADKYVYDPELYTPEEVEILVKQFPDRVEYRHWDTCCGKSRPWWHLCCNGNAGGWRTNLCDWLEGKWRNTVWKLTDRNFKSLRRAISDGQDIDLDNFGQLIVTDLIRLTDLQEEIKRNQDGERR